MSLPIPPEAVEAAARAMHESEGVAFAWDEMNETDQSVALLHQEAAIRAALEAMGARVEWERSAKAPACPYRLVSRWFPAQENSARTEQTAGRPSHGGKPVTDARVRDEQFERVEDFGSVPQPWRCNRCGMEFTRQDDFMVLMCEREGCRGEPPEAADDVEVARKVVPTDLDLAAQIGALRVAHDALGRIALMDSGVCGDWSRDALRRMKELLVDEEPARPFHIVEEDSEERRRELREDSFVPTEPRCIHCGGLASENAKQAEPICNRGGLVGPHEYRHLDAVDRFFDRATGQGRR